MLTQETLLGALDDDRVASRPDRGDKFRGARTRPRLRSSATTGVDLRRGCPSQRVETALQIEQTGHCRVRNSGRLWGRARRRSPRQQCPPVAQRYPLPLQAGAHAVVWPHLDVSTATLERCRVLVATRWRWTEADRENGAREARLKMRGSKQYAGAIRRPRAHASQYPRNRAQSWAEPHRRAAMVS